MAGQCGALKAICEAAIDPAFEKLQEALAVCLLFLLDDAKTRTAFRPGHDLPVCFLFLSALIITPIVHYVELLVCAYLFMTFHIVVCLLSIRKIFSRSFHYTTLLMLLCVFIYTYNYKIFITL